MGVNSRQLMLFLVFVALLVHTSTLWRLWLSIYDDPAAQEMSDLPMTGGITMGRSSDKQAVENAVSKIENIAQGSFFRFSVLRTAAGEGHEQNKEDDAKSRSFPSLAQIDQASVVLKRGTKVYLDYLHPLTTPSREEYTLVIAATISDLRKIFGQGRPPWDGPISCAIQVSQISEEIKAIANVVNENPAAFKHTSIHILLSDAMLVVEWSSVWVVALRGARSDLVMVLPEATASMTRKLNNAADNVRDYYAVRLKLEKSIIRIKEENNVGALLVSKRGGLLPMLKSEIKTKRAIIDSWIEEIQQLGFAVNTMTWETFASTDDGMHKDDNKLGLLEMGSMYVVGLDATIKGSIAIDRNLKAFTNFITPRYKPEGDEVCLATQMAFDKRERLVKLATAWGGVVSVSVLLSLTEIEGLVRFVRNNHMAFSYTFFHVVIHEQYEFYPINIMRNVATDAVETDFIFTVDLDFMPSLAAHNVIHSYTSHPLWGNQIRNSRNAWIIPAFEYTVSDMSDSDLFGSLPLTKAELVRSKDAIPFHINWFFKGHRPTDFDRWYKTDEPYEVRYEQGFEPYVVLCTRGHNFLPRYWEGFKGYKVNKRSWIEELNRAGWGFYVLPGEAFVIHMHHEFKSRKEMPNLARELLRFHSHLKATYDG
mmetsp:Transcript_22368/g.66296  ORF Transcript_22368/g.66296 Transcript_22368/m.66296 type:complete len:650 (-) Transcript_22368:65-2014(-)